MTDKTQKVFTRAHVPPELVQPWLQHLRDFDTAHPGCHFEVMIDGSPDTPLSEILARLRITPGLSFTDVFERGKPEG